MLCLQQAAFIVPCTQIFSLYQSRNVRRQHQPHLRLLYEMSPLLSQVSVVAFPLQFPITMPQAFLAFPYVGCYVSHPHKSSDLIALIELFKIISA